MKTYKHRVLSATAAILLAGHWPVLHAQDSNNVLGLPAVPQVPQPIRVPGAVAVPGASAAVPAKPTEADIKSAISGNIKLASFYQTGLVTVRVATDKTYIGAAQRAQALQAARLVQRDVRLSCGKLCKSAAMPPPTLLADNTLSFDLILSGYAGILSTVDMVNLVSAKAIGPGGKSVPPVIVTPPVTPAPPVSTAPASPPAPAAAPAAPSTPASAAAPS